LAASVNSWRGYSGLIPGRQDFCRCYAIDFREGCLLTEKILTPYAQKPAVLNLTDAVEKVAADKL
jgi:hypothetical protein